MQTKSYLKSQKNKKIDKDESLMYYCINVLRKVHYYQQYIDNTFDKSACETNLL